MIKRLICRILGHNWRYIPKPDIFSKKRECKRCGIKQLRTIFSSRVSKEDKERCYFDGFMYELWEDVK